MLAQILFNYSRISAEKPLNTSNKEAFEAFDLFFGLDKLGI